MARLGKRERELKRAIIHANLSAPKPEASRMAVRGKDGVLRIVTGDCMGRDSAERLKAAIGTATGGFQRLRPEYKHPTAPRFGKL